jgi:hypothetical protein
VSLSCLAAYSMIKFFPLAIFELLIFKALHFRHHM